jgi:hypothetical protein
MQFQAYEVDSRKGATRFLASSAPSHAGESFFRHSFGSTVAK